MGSRSAETANATMRAARPSASSASSDAAVAPSVSVSSVDANASASSLNSLLHRRSLAAARQKQREERAKMKMNMRRKRDEDEEEMSSEEAEDASMDSEGEELAHAALESRMRQKVMLELGEQQSARASNDQASTAPIENIKDARQPKFSKQVSNPTVVDGTGVWSNELVAESAAVDAKLETIEWETSDVQPPATIPSLTHQPSVQTEAATQELEDDGYMEDEFDAENDEVLFGEQDVAHDEPHVAMQEEKDEEEEWETDDVPAVVNQSSEYAHLNQVTVPSKSPVSSPSAASQGDGLDISFEVVSSEEAKAKEGLTTASKKRKSTASSDETTASKSRRRSVSASAAAENEEGEDAEASASKKKGVRKKKEGTSIVPAQRLTKAQRETVVQIQKVHFLTVLAFIQQQSSPSAPIGFINDETLTAAIYSIAINKCAGLFDKNWKIDPRKQSVWIGGVSETNSAKNEGIKWKSSHREASPAAAASSSSSYFSSSSASAEKGTLFQRVQKLAYWFRSYFTCHGDRALRSRRDVEHPLHAYDERMHSQLLHEVRCNCARRRQIRSVVRKGSVPGIWRCYKSCILKQMHHVLETREGGFQHLTMLFIILLRSMSVLTRLCYAIPNINYKKDINFPAAVTAASSAPSEVDAMLSQMNSMYETSFAGRYQNGQLVVSQTAALQPNRTFERKIVETLNSSVNKRCPCEKPFTPIVFAPPTNVSDPDSSSINLSRAVAMERSASHPLSPSAANQFRKSGVDKEEAIEISDDDDPDDIQVTGVQQATPRIPLQKAKSASASSSEDDDEEQPEEKPSGSKKKKPPPKQKAKSKTAATAAAKRSSTAPAVVSASSSSTQRPRAAKLAKKNYAETDENLEEEDEAEPEAAVVKDEKESKPVSGTKRKKWPAAKTDPVKKKRGVSKEDAMEISSVEDLSVGHISSEYEEDTAPMKQEEEKDEDEDEDFEEKKSKRKASKGKATKATRSKSARESSKASAATTSSYFPAASSSSSTAAAAATTVHDDLPDLSDTGSEPPVPLFRASTSPPVGQPTKRKKKRFNPAYPLMWCEFYCPERKGWIHLDVMRGEMDLPNLYEYDGELSLQAVVAIRPSVPTHKHLLIDVTKRYVSNWKNAIALRPDDGWWVSALEHFSGPCAAIDRDVENSDVATLEQRHSNLAEMPSRLNEFKNHPLYCIEKFLLRYEMIYPSGPEHAKGRFIEKRKGETGEDSSEIVHLVYPRANLHTLHTRDRWRRELRNVKAEEVAYPAKVVNKLSQMSRAQREEKIRLGLIPPDGEKSELYGIWQCEPFVAGEARDGIVPKNERGHVDVWNESHVPAGCVHLAFPRLKGVCKSLGVDFAEAMVGFEVTKGRSVPRFDGVVITKENEEKVMKTYWEREKAAQERAEKRRMAAIVGGWKKLIRGAIIKAKVMRELTAGKGTGELAELPNAEQAAAAASSAAHPTHSVTASRPAAAAAAPSVLSTAAPSLGGFFPSTSSAADATHVHNFTPMQSKQQFDEQTQQWIAVCACGAKQTFEEF